MKSYCQRKAVRENETAEENQHLPQCNTIPGSDSLNGNIHGVHLEPCYKKFTSILAPSRKQTLPEENYDKFERLKRKKCSQSNSGLFPKRCFIATLFVNAKVVKHSTHILSLQRMLLRN